MGVLSVGYGTQSAVISAEHSLSQMSGVGIYVLKVDTSEMQTGDTLEIRLKTDVLLADVLKEAQLEILADAQNAPHWYSRPLPVASGEEIVATITQTAGTGRSFPWNLMRM